MRYAFWGIRVAVVALVLSALVSMAKECPWNIVSYLLAAGAFVLVGLLGGQLHCGAHAPAPWLAWPPPS